MTYPHPLVAEYIGECLIPVKLMLNRREDQPYYREYRAIWTPTIGFLDRNGAMHYSSPGYLPPEEFLAMLRIGRARCLMAWTRNAEAGVELLDAAENAAMGAEALYWLGVSRFLARRETEGMWEAWDRLVARYPDSAWARRVYPR